MDEELLKIYTLMQLAEDHLKALNHTTAELRAGQDGLARDRSALKKTAAEQTGNLLAAALSLQNVGADIRREAQNAAPALQEATQKAVEASIAQLLPRIATRAAEGLETASESILERLAGATVAAQAAETALKTAGQWFAWKWIALAGATSAGLLLAAYGVLTVLARSHDAELVTRHQTLVQEIARLQDTAAALEKRTYGVYLVSGSDGVFLVTPKGTQTTQCRAGPCIRLQDPAR